MQLLIKNLTASNLSLDLQPFAGARPFRATLAPQGSVDVGAVYTPAALNADPVLKTLIAKGYVKVTSQSQTTDIPALTDDTLFEVNQHTAASVATTFLATSEATGVPFVTAQVGAIPAVGESIAVDVLVNGTSILTAPISLSHTTVTAARQQLTGSVVAGTVINVGDEISYSLTYTAGGGPTPIVNTAVRVQVLKS